MRDIFRDEEQTLTQEPNPHPGFSTHVTHVLDARVAYPVAQAPLGARESLSRPHTPPPPPPGVRIREDMGSPSPKVGGSHDLSTAVMALCELGDIWVV